MDALVKISAEPTGPEWFTVADFSAHYGLGLKQASRVVSGLHKDGKLERWAGRQAATQRFGYKFRVKP